MKNLFSKITDFIKKFLWLFLILLIARIIFLHLYPPILYALFWFIYIIWIRNYWLWALKLEYIKKYIKGYLDLRLMIGFGLTYFFIVPFPLMLLSIILAPVVFIIGLIYILLVAGIIMKIIRKLNINVGNINKDKFDKRFEKINQLLKDKIITQEEYEKLRKKIIEDI